MDELRTTLRRIEENQAPDYWADVERRRGSGPIAPEREPRRWPAAAVAAILALAGTGLVVEAFRGDGSHPIPPVRASTFPTSEDMVSIDLGGDRGWSGPLVVGDSAAWIVGTGGSGDYEVLRIDPQTLRVTERMPLGFGDSGREPSGLTVGDGSVWVSVERLHGSSWDIADGEILRLDETTGEITGRFDTPPASGGVLFAFGGLWLADTNHDSLLHLDPTTGVLLGQTAVGHQPGSMFEAFGSLWVQNQYGEGSLTRVDPFSEEVVATFDRVFDVSAGDRVIWAVANGDPNGRLKTIDPSTNQLADADIGLNILPAFVAQDRSRTWLATWVEDDVPGPSQNGAVQGPVSLPGRFTVRPIDPSTGAELADPIDVCPSPAQPIIAFDALWFPCSSRVLHLPLSDG